MQNIQYNIFNEIDVLTSKNRASAQNVEKTFCGQQSDIFENRKITTGYRLKFKANCIIKTEVNEWLNGNWDKVRIRQDENLKNNSTNGMLSKSAKAKLKSSINWLIIAAKRKNVMSLKYSQAFKFKINFITLTIPPQMDGLIDEKKFKTVLNVWLTYHRKYSNLNNYVWKIEKHKDGRLHIHILADSFIHHASVRKSWNLILKRNGLLEFHYTKFQNYDPNSTDIHSIKKVKKVAAYVVKYMAKDGTADKLYNGRVWSCSSKIAAVNGNCLEISPEHISEFTNILAKAKIDYDYIKTEPNQFNQTFIVAEIHFLKVKDWLKLKGSLIYDFFRSLIESLRSDKVDNSQLIFTYSI